MRWASAADQHLCCLQLQLTPDHDTVVTVHSGLDGTGFNLDRPPIHRRPPTRR